MKKDDKLSEFNRQQLVLASQLYDSIYKELEVKYRLKYKELAEYYDIQSQKAKAEFSGKKQKGYPIDTSSQVTIRAYKETRDYLRVIQALTKETMTGIVHRLVEDELDKLT